MTDWEEIRPLHLHESLSPMGQLRVMLTQYHWAEVFLEKSNARVEIFFYLFVHLYITRITISNGTSYLKSPKNQNRRAPLGRPAI